MESLEAFTFLCCPECVYRSQEVNNFQAHALQNHPQASTLFCSNSSNFLVNDVKEEPLEVNVEAELKSDEEDKDFEGGIHLESLEDLEDIKPEDVTHETIEEDDDNDSYKRSGSKKYSCKFCPQVFPKRSLLRLHVRSDHEHPVQCDECDRKFDNPAKLTQHKYMKHKEEYCEECNKSFPKAVYNRHMKTVHVNKDNKSFICDQCPFATHAQRYLSEHKTTFHSKKAHDEDTSFNYYAMVQKGNLDSDDLVPCPECNKLVKGKGVLIHYRKAHGCLPPGYKDGKRFICDQCSVDFASMQSLRKHTESAHGDHKEVKLPQETQTFRCEECLADFTGFRYLLIHFRLVHKDIPPEYKDQPQFICDQCPDIFLSEAHLKGHISRKHTKSNYLATRRRQYDLKKCPHCEKTFKSHNPLKEHILVKHENNTPHQCDLCPRKFGLNHSLRVHKKLVHTKVRCDICNEEVCNSFVLKRHKASVHGIVPSNSFKCHLCPLFFHAKKSLQNHLEMKHS